MTKIYLLPANQGFVIENKDANTPGFQYTLSGGVATVTATDTKDLEENLPNDGAVIGEIQNAIIAATGKATVSELSVLLAHVNSL